MRVFLRTDERGISLDTICCVSLTFLAKRLYARSRDSNLLGNVPRRLFASVSKEVGVKAMNPKKRRGYIS